MFLNMMRGADSVIPYSEQERFRQFMPTPVPDTELDYFFSHAYHDMRFFMKSVTESNTSTFTYFGDMQRNLFYISDNMRDTFGFDSNVVEDLLTKWRTRIRGEKWRELYDQDQQDLLNEKRDSHDMRYQVEDKDGKVFWIRCYGALQWNADRTKPLFFAGRIAKQDENFAVDPITSFPLESTLHHQLQDIAKREESYLTIGFSLNNITQINAMYGRGLCDKMISRVAMELTDHLIEKMTFYRLSGIRCLALVHQKVTETKEELVQQIREIVEDGYRRMGFVVDNPCSFAVMTYPQPNLSPGDFQENMLSLIKLAAGEPQLPFVENSERNIQRISEMANLQMTITQNVLDGMKNFRAVIQPVVSADTGLITAGETLLRWRYQGQNISPGVFIPILEKDRMIHIAGRWIMEEAVKACSNIVKYLPEFYLSVNISLQQLYDEELTEFIPQVLQKYQLEGRHLVVEMTESSMDREPERLRKLIDVCHENGVRLALDDFGTGYSSLRVLLQYNTNIIKIDRSLLLEMSESADKSNFISSIVYACHQFGKKVCMEGVEDERQRRLVQDAQCDLIQGFFYFRPMELPDVYDAVKRQHEILAKNS